MEYTRQEVDTGIERKIITGLIVSNSFCKQAIPMLRLDYFKAKAYRRIASWAMDYYEDYGKAPNGDMETIYLAERKKLKPEESDQIQDLLQAVSDEYVAGDKFNSPYLVAKTVEFAKKRDMQKMADDILLNLERDDVKKADAVLKKFMEANKQFISEYRWSNPFDEKVIDETFSSDEDEELFKLPGVMGDLVGMLKREWLISFLGPMKRGKSWYLLWLAYEGLTQGCKVVYISLEMSAKEVRKRLYAMLTAAAKKPGTINIPVFDCKHNQDGSCEMEERENAETLNRHNNEGFPMPVDMGRNPNYKVCNYCRGKRGMDYSPAVWYRTHEADQLDAEITKKKMQIFRKLFKTHLRVIDYPPYVASWEDIVKDVDALEDTEGFIPSLWCTDYFDIMGADKEDQRLSERGMVDAKWKKGKREAKERKLLMATVQQGNRGSLSKPDLENEDTSEDIRKLAHQDLQMGLNQTSDEKLAGIMRINVMAHRHEEFNILGQVILLQSFKLGQPFLDMEYEEKTYRRIYGGSKKAPRQQQARAARGRQRRE